MIELRREPLDGSAATALLAGFHDDVRRIQPGWDPERGPGARPEDFAGEAGVFLVAYLDGAPAGCGGLKRLDRRTGEVKRLYVAPAARRRGVARALLAALEQAAAAAGCELVRLDTGVDHLAALRLFRSAGYREIADYNGNPFAGHWFEKRVGGHPGKYARLELERRFLVRRAPAGLDGAHGWEIADRYIDGTRLRLRAMRPLGGGASVFKLGQKLAPFRPDYSRTIMTTTYLTAEEHTVLAALPARELVKRRHLVEERGRRYGVDVFCGALAGLILAETGYASEAEMEADRAARPPWLGREVSGDERLTGGALAALTPVGAAALLAELRPAPR